MIEQITSEITEVSLLQAADDNIEQSERYVVRLPIFEGPLDLLLHLIEKRQMEITTISLFAVTDQYLAYLQQWEAEDLPLANIAAFISIAARLLFIKSQSLLPRTSKDELSGETESAAEMAEELQRHLVEYKLANRWYLVGEYDRFSALNFGLKWRIYSK